MEQHTTKNAPSTAASSEKWEDREVFIVRNVEIRHELIIREVLDFEAQRVRALREHPRVGLRRVLHMQRSQHFGPERKRMSRRARVKKAESKCTPSRTNEQLTNAIPNCPEQLCRALSSKGPGNTSI